VRWARFAIVGLRNLFRRSTLERDARNEFAFHLDCRTEELMRRGIPRADAERRARIEFGNVVSYTEQATDARLARTVEDLLRDVAYACRSLRRNPALVVTCAVSLGIGIGINTTIVTTLRPLFLHEPTVTDAERVVGVEPGNSNQFSYPNYRDLRSSGIFEDTVGYRFVRMNLQTSEGVEPLLGAAVTATFFDGLGVSLLVGRTFAADEGDPDRQPRVAVVSYDLWQRRLHGTPAVVGQTLRLNGEVFHIVGILPKAYRPLTPIPRPEVFVPLSALVMPNVQNRQNANGLTVLGRLRPGATREQAQAAVTLLGQELERIYPQANRGLSRPASVFPVAELPLRGAPSEILVLPIIVLVLFGFVLLIACANVAALLLARTATRRHELAMRVALGARRGRLIQTLLAESLVLGLIGAACGLVLTLCLVPFINAFALPGVGPGGHLQIELDGWLIAYGLLLALATSVLCGLVPAVRGTHLSVVAELHDAGTVGITGRLRLRHAFVVGQVALSTFLLVLSALFLRTATQAASMDPGFDINGGLVAKLTLQPGRSNEARTALVDRLTERLLVLKNVSSVGVANLVPLGGDSVRRGFQVEGEPYASGRPTCINSVGPHYFMTMGIPLLRGREFQPTDRLGAPPVVIVSETFADRYFPGQDALGRFVRSGDDPFAEIVGIVAASKYERVTEEYKPLLYYSFAQRPSDPVFHVRVAGSPVTMVATIRSIAEALDPTALVDVRTLYEAASLEVALRRTASALLGGLGTLGVVLAMIGLYGVMAYIVTSRSTEIGIRMALGATSRRVVRTVVVHGMALTATGVIIGIPASLALTIPLRGLLAGVSPLDPSAIGAVVIALLATGVCASYVPALRAARGNPMAALRLQ
jgi:putative ABC transport system permease protein